jgi:hypothetical protein
MSASRAGAEGEAGALARPLHGRFALRLSAAGAAAGVLAGAIGMALDLAGIAAEATCSPPTL